MEIRSDWRFAKQEEGVGKKLKILCAGLCVLGGICAWGLFFHGLNKWFTIGSLVLIPICLGLYIAFPAYFSLVPDKEHQKYGVLAPVMNPLIPMMLSIIGLLLGGGTFGLAWTWKNAVLPVASMAAIASIVALLTRRFAPECWEHGNLSWIAGMMIGLILLLEIPGVNHLLAPEPAEQTLVIAQEVRTARKRGARCVFLTEAGEEIDMPIPHWAYRAMSVGDHVPVFLNEGFFGIQYAWFDNETYTQMLNE